MKQYKFGSGTQEKEIYLLSREEFEREKGNLPYAVNMIKSISPVQYCKVEAFRDCIIGTIKVPEKSGKEKKGLTFGVYIKDNSLYVVDEGIGLEKTVQKLIENVPEKSSATHLFLYILELLLEDDVIFLLNLEEEMEKLEETLLEKMPQNFYNKLIKYRKELYRLHAYYEQLMNIGDSLQDYLAEDSQREENAAWQHYTNRAERLHNHTEMLREYLVQIRELYQARIDMQQNRVMSFLTVVTTIFLPLTLIAGWYGMNFTTMPELGWKYGYLVVIAVSAFIMICEIIYFTRKKKSWSPE